MELSQICQVEAASGDWLADASRMAGVAGRARCVARPGTPEEVAAVVAWCYERDVPVVPRGGGTGFSGGAVPLDEAAVVLSLDRLDRVRSIDPGLWRMEAEAGVTTRTVQRVARENGLWWPVDPGAAEQSHVGGNVATNAGGPHTFKHGVTRTWVTGLEVVLAPGELVRLGGATRKDVAGYDLVGLLCGSEGTLGVVTSVFLRLAVPPAEQVPLACFYADAREGCEAMEAVMASGAVPGAIEYLDAGSIRAAGAAFPGGAPEGAGFLLLVDAEEGVEDLLEALGPDARRMDAAELWRWREGVSLAVAGVHGGKLSEDVAVPLDRLAEAIEETVEIAARHRLDGCSWGHAGDGNLHSTFLLRPGDAEQRARADAAAEDLFAMAARLGGTISGEHGLGLLKNGRLGLQWGEAAVAAHRAIKAALDPKGLFNPGKKLA